MKTVYLAVTGGDQLISIPGEEPGEPSQDVSTFQIHGVFSTKEEYRRFEGEYGKAHLFSGLREMEIPLDATYGMITRNMIRYHVVFNEKLEIESVSKSDKSAMNTDPYIQNVHRAGGFIDVFCYALDRKEACKLAYEECYLETIGDWPEDDMEEKDVVAKLTIHMPTSSPVSFELPAMFKIPVVGEMFEIKFEDYITDPDEWELALSTLENDVMVVDRIEGNEVWLREGNPD